MKVVGVLLALAVLLVGCGADPVEPLERRAVPPPLTVDPARPCTRPAPASVPPAAASGAVAVDPATGVVSVRAGTVDLPRLAQLAPGAVTEVGPGAWILRRSVRILPGASLEVAVPRLSLVSAPGDVVSVVADGGALRVTGTCVTSWDPRAARTDGDRDDGRAFLAAENGGRLEVRDAEIHDLGFGDVGSYGLSWRGRGTSGGISGSLVTGLHYGLYTDQADGIVVHANEFASNVVYGIDPHTGSTGLSITDNLVHDNGKHGIVLAKDCSDNLIRGNVVYRNGHHGIVLYDHSDRNVVEGNESFANGGQGIDVSSSTDSTLRANRVYDNRGSGIVVTEISSGVLVEDNVVEGNRDDGVRVVGDSTASTVQRNRVISNDRSGIAADGLHVIVGNAVTGNGTGLMVRNAPLPAETDNALVGNEVDTRPALR